MLEWLNVSNKKNNFKIIKMKFKINMNMFSIIYDQNCNFFHLKHIIC
jgi:hypothetical protein